MQHLYQIKLLSLVLPLILFAGCGKNEPNDDNNEPVSPNVTVPDPEGTITLKMRNSDYGRTMLDDCIQISNGNNLVVSGGEVVSIGKVKGLGNIVSIPLNGWAQQVAIAPGNGYIVYAKKTYYRIYVIDWILAAETNGIIGAEIKYQKPFAGIDEVISIAQSSYTLPKGSGVFTIDFNNSTIIPYDASIEGPFTIREESKVQNSIMIQHSANTSINTNSGVLHVKTLYGKETTITLTQDGETPWAELSGYVSLPCVGQNLTKTSIAVKGNVPFEELMIESNEKWCEPSLLKESSKTIVRITSQNNYSLALRSATLTLKRGDKELSTLQIFQKGATFEVSGGLKGLSPVGSKYSIQLKYSPFTAKDIKVEYDDSIIYDVGEIPNSGSYLSFRTAPNCSDQKRTTKLIVSAPAFDIRKEVLIEQDGTNIVFYNYSGGEYYFDKNSSSYEISISCQVDLTSDNFVSSEDWCSVSLQGKTNLVVRVTATTESRNAIISIPGFEKVLKVYQSKYGVGDTYNENGQTATVFFRDVWKGLYAYIYLGQAAWSTESVEIANDYKDGVKNFEEILSVTNWETLYPAFALCNQLNANNNIKWYIPAVDETCTSTLFQFQKNFENKTDIWSSTGLTGGYKNYAYTCSSRKYSQKNTQSHVFAVCRLY
jgi:hypothetical protein